MRETVGASTPVFFILHSRSNFLNSVGRSTEFHPTYAIPFAPTSGCARTNSTKFFA